MDAGKYKQQQRPRVRPTHVQSRVISPVIAVLKWQNFATNGKIAEIQSTGLILKISQI